MPLFFATDYHFIDHYSYKYLFDVKFFFEKLVIHQKFPFFLNFESRLSYSPLVQRSEPEPLCAINFTSLDSNYKTKIVIKYSSEI